MAATHGMIEAWFDRGCAQGAAYMIVWCDTYDRSDYPSYHKTKEDALADKATNGQNMKRLMEIYDLHADKAPQMAVRRMMAL